MALQDLLGRIAGEIPWAPSELAALSEDDAKRELIDPILAELGWSGLNRLRREYSVEAEQRMKMDYALLGSDRKPVALVEAKRPRENLGKHVDQVLKYAFYEGVDICALTNGKLWWLYLPREKGKADDRCFATLDVTSLFSDEVSQILERTLGYQALATGAAERHAKELLKKRKDDTQRIAEIPRAWRRLLNEPSWHLIRLIEEEVYQATGQRPADWEIIRALPEVFGESAHPTLADRKRGAIAMRNLVPAVEGVVGVKFLRNRDTSGQPNGVNTARNLVMYFARKYTAASYTTIARALGTASYWATLRDVGSNETTVEEGFRLIEEQLRSAEGREDPNARIRLWYREICKRFEIDP